jgi:hypothetical protein
MFTHPTRWTLFVVLLYLTVETVTHGHLHLDGSHTSEMRDSKPSGDIYPFQEILGVQCYALPKQMETFADYFIKRYPEQSADKLPEIVKTEVDLITWCSSWEPLTWWPEGSKWAFLECYRYKDYVFLTIKLAPDQKVGDRKNLAHCIIANLKTRTYFMLYGSRS